jgi:hypothetical protein
MTRLISWLLSIMADGIWDRPVTAPWCDPMEARRVNERPVEIREAETA